MGRGDLSDAEWERLRPFLPVSRSRPQPTRRVRSTGTFRWTPRSCGPTSTPPALAPNRRLRQRGMRRQNTRSKPCGRASSPAWWRWCGRRGSGPLAGRVHQQAPPERGRSLPPAVPDRHAGAASGLHPVHRRAGEDPSAADRTGRATQEARQPGGRQGIQQQALPRIPTTAGHPAHHPGEE